MNNSPRRFPPAPLVAASGLTLRALAIVLEIDPANLCRPISDRQADRWTTRLDLRPETIWPTWYDDTEGHDT